MKLTVTNLGRIKSAELDLRPLTVFVGANNTNKSWVAYCAHAGASAQAYETARAGRIMMTSDGQAILSEVLVRDAEAALQAGETHTIRVVRAEPDVEQRIRLDAQTVGRLLATQPHTLGDCSAVVVHSATDLASGLFETLAVVLEPTGAQVRAKSTFAGVGGEARASYSFPRSELLTFLSAQVAALNLSTRWRAVAFPVDRLVGGRAGFADLPAEDGLLPEPVEHHWRMVQDAKHRASSGLEDGSPDLEELLRRAAFPGPLMVSADEGIGFGVGAFSLPVHASASLGQSMASFGLYLRALASPGDSLFIDEPEMNAHPAAQLALTELFAVMVNRGYRILFTTHSPYVTEHLSTLLEGSLLSREAKERVAKGFQLGEADAFLDPEKVAVYEFVEVGEHVEVNDVLDREDRSIITGTFARETERLGKLMNRVLDEETAG